MVLKITALNPNYNDQTKLSYVITKVINKMPGLVEVTYEPNLDGIAGAFSGLTFTGTEEDAYNAFITATLKCNTELSQKLTVFIGSKQISLYDFEYVTGEENKDASNYIPSYSIPVNGANWLTANGYSGYRNRAEELYEEGYPFFMWPNASVADNDSVSADIVSAEDGAPVRFARPPYILGGNSHPNINTFIAVPSFGYSSLYLSRSFTIRIMPDTFMAKLIAPRPWKGGLPSKSSGIVPMQ